MKWNARFELSKITESYLIIEKVNFVRLVGIILMFTKSGKLVEKNKFYVPPKMATTWKK